MQPFTRAFLKGFELGRLRDGRFSAGLWGRLRSGLAQHRKLHRQVLKGAHSSKITITVTITVTITITIWRMRFCRLSCYHVCSNLFSFMFYAILDFSPNIFNSLKLLRYTQPTNRFNFFQFHLSQWRLIPKHLNYLNGTQSNMGDSTG